MIKFLLRLWSAKSFFRHFGTMGRRMSFLREAVVLFYCLRDSRTPKGVRLAILAAIGYLLAPVDLIPDVLLGLGWLDDAAVVGMVMKLAERYILPEHVLKAKKFTPFSGK